MPLWLRVGAGGVAVFEGIHPVSAKASTIPVATDNMKNRNRVIAVHLSHGLQYMTTGRVAAGCLPTGIMGYESGLSCYNARS